MSFVRVNPEIEIIPPASVQKIRKTLMPPVLTGDEPLGKPIHLIKEAVQSTAPNAYSEFMNLEEEPKHIIDVMA